LNDAPAQNDVDHVLLLAKGDLSEAASAIRALAQHSADWPSFLLAQVERLLVQMRHDDLVGLVYLLAEISQFDMALLVAEHAYQRASDVDPIVIALADMYHRRGDYAQALEVTERHLSDVSSDWLISKFCDFARDVGKSFRAEDMLTYFMRRGRTQLLVRLADHYFESRNWVALRNCLEQAPQNELSDYLIYFLGRANVSLLLESAVIACADRLWAMANPGPRFAQLLLDVWRWRIGDIENFPPQQDPEGLPWWLSRDAQAICDAAPCSFDLSTTVRSSTGWRTLRPRENLPNVVAIGTQRSATTWLHYHLSQRPGVQPLPHKEPVFFSDAFASMRDIDPAFALSETIEDPYWYGPTRNLFRYLRLYGAGFAIRADFSPSYFELPEDSIAAIRDLLGPDVHILLSVRDPVDRSWSNLKYDMKLAGVDVGTLSFVERMAHYMSDVSYRRSDYAATLGRWSRHFRHIKVLFFDDISARPAALLDEVTDFIGLPRLQAPDIADPINSSFDGDVPLEDRMFLLGLHRRHYEEAEALLGGPALSWRVKHLDQDAGD